MATKKTTGASGKTAPLDPKVARKLLDKLSTDNEFRRLFKKDPKAALISVGYKEPLDDGAADKGRWIHDCCTVERIAPKADIIKAREELHAVLTSGLALIPQKIDATYGVKASTLRRK